jgi:serine/threonine-protein kinase
MNHTHFLNKAPSTSAEIGSPWSQVSLPPELLAEASRRLGWLGLVYACSYTLAYWGLRVVARISQPEHFSGPVQNTAAVVSILLGLVVFALSRTARMSPKAFLDLGLVFAVIGSFGISIAEFARGLDGAALVSGAYVGIPWECVWIVVFPLIAPNTPRKILVASLGSASSAPLTLWLASRSSGAEFAASTPMLVGYFATTVGLCVVLAFVMSRIILRYGVRLTKAREVGSYELVRELGAGGMGEVWVAKHRMLARPAAVKLIRPELLGSDSRSREIAGRRFEREAQATAALGSAHTVDIYDFGATDDGAFFYVMELLDGFSLEELVKRHGPVSAARAVFLLRQVCHSLGAAHARGIIHRDIKPANIFTCALGPDFDFVKVLDFGLVKISDGSREAADLTADGITAGTPAYMAPEMALAKPDVDGRADLYAVGCVAYWVLTGQQVFEGETAVSTNLRHVREQPVPPSQRTEVPIPPGIEAVILSCLAKDPAQRPQTASELSLRLRSSLGGDPWTGYDACEWWQLHRPKRDL